MFSDAFNLSQPMQVFPISVYFWSVTPSLGPRTSKGLWNLTQKSEHKYNVNPMPGYKQLGLNRHNSCLQECFLLRRKTKQNLVTLQDSSQTLPKCCKCPTLRKFWNFLWMCSLREAARLLLFLYWV